LMMSLWDALRMNMMISYQELVRTFPSICGLRRWRRLPQRLCFASCTRSASGRNIDEKARFSAG
ncbi:hypothetical protein EJ893_01910, partial [Klebsiella pneumoniae subsp. pneumoniae]